MGDFGENGVKMRNLPFSGTFLQRNRLFFTACFSIITIFTKITSIIRKVISETINCVIFLQKFHIAFPMKIQYNILNHRR